MYSGPHDKVFDPHTQEVSCVGRNEYSTCHSRIILQIIQYPCLPASFWHFTGQDGALQVLQSAQARLSSSLCDHSAWYQSSHPVGLLPILFPQLSASRSPPPLIHSRLTKIHPIFKGWPFWANPSLLDE